MKIFCLLDALDKKQDEESDKIKIISIGSPRGREMVVVSLATGTF